MRTDDELRAWRDAAQSGGLPAPHRERWQALRAGVVNLWEFEAVEYWYADGWVQLMGRNEAGKSSLMALTTLIPWLADTSSDKIDTLGRSGKQFAYYVRPTGTDGDRRDATASFFHGWLWVEYGRVTDDGPRFFTTLLYSSARTGSQKVALEWCTSEGSRVREALRLAVDRDVVSPKAIDAPGFHAHASGQLYKAAVAERLLGTTVDKLETIGKILKVTRTPKLGAQLDVRFVTEHLRDALPELRQGEIDQLAQGWDQLDQIRGDLERAESAATLVERFAQRSWRPWLGARLRLDADDAAAQRTNFDRVTREEEAAKKTLADERAADDDLTRQVDAATLAADTAAAAAEQLRESAAYKDAASRIENARHAEDELRAADGALAAAAREAHGAAGRLVDAETTEQQESGDADEARRRVDRAVEETRRAAETAGIPSTEADLDADRLRQRAEQRARAADKALALLRVAEDAQTAAANQEALAGAEAARADEAAAAAEAAWGVAEDEHEKLASRVEAWAAAAPRPVLRATAWIEALPRTADGLAAPALALAIRAEWYEPLRDDASARRSAAVAAEKVALAEAARLRAEIAALEQAGVVPPPSPTLWRRRSRADQPGAPLWRLLNPAPGVPAEELAHVEAALAASGLLDAWVEPSGARGLDTYTAAPDEPGDGARLSALLRVADDAGELGAAAQAVLDGVALRGAAEPLPGTGLAIAVDGRWRLRPRGRRGADPPGRGVAGRGGARVPTPPPAGRALRPGRRGGEPGRGAPRRAGRGPGGPGRAGFGAPAGAVGCRAAPPARRRRHPRRRGAGRAVQGRGGAGPGGGRAGEGRHLPGRAAAVRDRQRPAGNPGEDRRRRRGHPRAARRATDPAARARGGGHGRGQGRTGEGAA